jgi:hypothetical protein
MGVILNEVKNLVLKILRFAQDDTEVELLIPDLALISLQFYLAQPFLSDRLGGFG